MTVNDILDKVNLYANAKTFYVQGCPCVLLTSAMKAKYTSNSLYNAKRTKEIFDLVDDTIGLDEYTFFTEVTGFKCDNFGDMLASCIDISKNFKNIVPGEVVFADNNFGFYTGAKRVVTVTREGVKVVPLKDWVSHAKIKGVNYDKGTVEGNSEGKKETEKNVGRDETDVEVRDDRTGDRNRMQQMSSQNKGNRRDNGGHRN